MFFFGTRVCFKLAVRGPDLSHRALAMITMVQITGIRVAVMISFICCIYALDDPRVAIKGNDDRT